MYGFKSKSGLACSPIVMSQCNICHKVRRRKCGRNQTYCGRIRTGWVSQFINSIQFFISIHTEKYNFSTVFHVIYVINYFTRLIIQLFYTSILLGSKMKSDRIFTRILQLGNSYNSFTYKASRPAHLNRVDIHSASRHNFLACMQS